MTGHIVVLGGGGHGREVLGLIRAINAVQGGPVWTVLGVLDDELTPDNRRHVDRLGVAYLGSLAWLDSAPGGVRVALGIGDPSTRRAVADRIAPRQLSFPALVHPDATVGDDVHRADGLLAFAGSRVTTNVTLGRHVHLNQNTTVGHDCVIGDFVSVNPLAAVSGCCHLETGCLVGTTAAVLQGRRVGAGATVGAGACVVRDVPPGITVKGVPAR